MRGIESASHQETYSLYDAILGAGDGVRDIILSRSGYFLTLFDGRQTLLSVIQFGPLIVDSLSIFSA